MLVCAGREALANPDTQALAARLAQAEADADRERILIKRDRVRERLTVDGDEPK
jgi:hypothetical protein